jgi:DNA-directed RNA polymerase specialized sigma24 family protein
MPDSIDEDLYCCLDKLLSNRKQMLKLQNHAARLLEDKTQGLFARPFLAGDIVNTVFEKILYKKYHWDKNNCSLHAFIWNRISTHCFNIIKHEGKFLPVEIKEHNADYNDYDDFTSESPEPPTPEELLIESDYENSDKNDNYIDPLEFTKTAFELFKDSPEEFCVLDEMYKGFKPRQIAEHLGLNVTQVYNIRQRIKRTLLNYYYNK